MKESRFLYNPNFVLNEKLIKKPIKGGKYNLGQKDVLPFIFFSKNYPFLFSMKIIKLPNAPIFCPSHNNKKSRHSALEKFCSSP